MNIPGYGDLGYYFRTQEPRSLDQIDQLLQRQEQLRFAIGLERAHHIENNTDLFSDAEKFCIYNAKARFRATVSTTAAVIGVSTFAAPQLGFANGRKLLLHYKGAAVAGAALTYFLSYEFWQFYVGWTPRQWNEFLYAKNVKMLRNIQIQQ